MRQARPLWGLRRCERHLRWRRIRWGRVAISALVLALMVWGLCRGVSWIRMRQEAQKEQLHMALLGGEWEHVRGAVNALGEPQLEHPLEGWEFFLGTVKLSPPPGVPSGRALAVAAWCDANQL